jgi:hypothetical protein
VRTPSQTAWLAGAAGLVLMLLTGGGWLAWQGIAASSPAPEHPDPRPVPADEVAFGAPTMVDGVPWGYPLTPDGAAAAAVTAVAVTGQPEAVFDPARFAAIARVVFTAEQVEVQQRQVDAARSEFELSDWGRQPASRRMYFFAPLAVGLTNWDPAVPSAEVEVWSMTLVGVGEQGGAVFTTSTVTLAAIDGTWAVTGLASVEGPTPLVHGVASAPGRTRALLRDATATWPLPLLSADAP